MQIIGLPIAATFKASTLAEKYHLDIDTARKLKKATPIDVDNETGARMVTDGIVIQKLRKPAVKPVIGGKK